MTDEAIPLASRDGDRRTAFICSLRELADFLEQHPAVATPHYLTMNVFVQTRDDVVQHAREASWTKDYNGQFFSLQKSFGEDLSYEITAPRETVCRRIVKGTTVVPEQVVEEVEWVCEDAPLLATS